MWQARLAAAVERWRVEKEKHGFDGVALLGGRFDGFVQDAWIVFRPAQVKSVENTGTWSPTDPRVSFNRSAEPFLAYGRMTLRELETQRVLQDRTIVRRRETLRGYEAHDRPQNIPKLLAETRSSLAWVEAERAHLQAELRRRRGRA